MGYPTLARTALIQSEVALKPPNSFVAFTRGFFEFPAIHNLYRASHVFYDSFFLQYGRCHAHGGPVGAHHGRNEIVGDRKRCRNPPCPESSAAISRGAAVYRAGDCTPRSARLAFPEAP